MPIFVHLAPETEIRHIHRAGIRAARVPPGAQAHAFGITRGVFALPVLPNFQTSHQWLRELRRRGPRQLVGVYFRIDDGEQVHIGRYNREHERVTAAKAAGMLLDADDPYGYEVMIPHAIPASAITGIRGLCQLTGWRHYPGANGKQPYCCCPYCQRGNIKSQRLRQQFQP